MEMNSTRKIKEPLFHITKKDNVPLKKKFLVYGISIICTVLVVSLLLRIIYNRGIVDFLTAMFDGNFGTKRRIWLLFYDISILLLISLAVCPAFKMKFWNIGADGQALMGALCATICMYYLGEQKHINNTLLIFIELAAAILGGVVWAVIPAIFKAIWNTNETLFTLMMNYVAIQLVKFFISSVVKSGSGVLNPMTSGMLPQIGGNKWLLTIIVVVIMTAIITIYLKYTKHGYELALVGESVPTAKYAGLNVKKVIIRTLILSGVLCGLAGFLLVSGTVGTVSSTTIDNRGFTAIIVTWMAKFNPLFMILTSFFVIFINSGTAELLSNIGVTRGSLKNIVVGLFFFFIIGCEFFLNYKVNFSSRITESKFVLKCKEIKNKIFKQKEKKEEKDTVIYLQEQKDLEEKKEVESK